MIINEQKSGFENVLQSGKSAQGGMVEFLLEKEKNVTFSKPFTSIPKISVDLDNDSNAVPYTLNITLTGFKIRFKIAYLGNVFWTAIQV